MKNKKRLILVLGMKRSGTSALTKGLEVMGVSLGNNLMPPPKFNKTGTWEDLDFHALNLEILNFFNDRFRRIAPLTEEELTSLLKSDYVARASQLLLEKISDDRPLGVKVPTFSLLLPFWEKVCDINGVILNTVIALRNPVSVAISAERSFSDFQEKSFWSWISAMLSALTNSERCERILIDYDELIKNPSHQIKRVAKVLNLNIKNELLKDYSHQFIDPSLRHVVTENYHFSNNDLCLKLAIKMYDRLLPVAMDQKSWSTLKKPLQKWTKKLSTVQGLLSILEMYEFSNAKLVDLNLQLQKSGSAFS